MKQKKGDSFKCSESGLLMKITLVYERKTKCTVSEPDGKESGETGRRKLTRQHHKKREILEPTKNRNMV